MPSFSNPNPEQSRIEAPFSPEQVAALNLFQESGVWHPFTSESGCQLIATSEGWVEEPGGPVVQTWAHAFMANEELIRERAEALSGKLPAVPNDAVPNNTVPNNAVPKDAKN